MTSHSFLRRLDRGESNDDRNDSEATVYFSNRL